MSISFCRKGVGYQERLIQIEKKALMTNFAIQKTYDKFEMFNPNVVVGLNLVSSVYYTEFSIY